jgi:hypothetical protein
MNVAGELCSARIDPEAAEFKLERSRAGFGSKATRLEALRLNLSVRYASQWISLPDKRQNRASNECDSTNHAGS